MVEPQTLQDLAVSELERTLGCQLIHLDNSDAMGRQSQTAQVALLEITPENHQQLAHQLLGEFMVRPYEHLILFQRQPGEINLDPFWQCRLALYVPTFSSYEALYSALDQFFSRQREASNVQQKLQEASDIAMLSMSASSQLGEIIRFLEQSYECSDYEALGDLLNQTLERLGVAGCGVIEADDGGVIYFGSGERQDAWQRLMLEMRSQGRFVDIDNRTITNFDTISVMARNMPEIGSEPYGRMKDMLFTLVEGAEARVKTLALERAVTMSEKAKSIFLRVMSHELRTPMNAILGFSTKLTAKDVGAPFSLRELSAVSMIKDNADRLMEMIEDLEDLSSVNVDTQNAKRRVLVVDVLSETLRLSAEHAQAKGLKFISDIPESGLQAELDPMRLNQVLKKLCANAIRYTEQGEIKVSLRTEYDATLGEQLLMSVADTGIGMSAARVKQLFRPVSQLYEDYMHHIQGAGLGVTVVKEFVAEMGGVIDVTSEENKGTCFSISVPQFIQHKPADNIELF